MWSKITLYKYQRIEKINSKDIDNLEKSLLSACIYYGITEWQLDNMKPKKAAKKMLKMANDISKEIKPIAKKRIGKYCIEYDINKMTFGQYISIAYFLQMGLIEGGHLILATVANPIYNYCLPSKFKNNTTHSKIAEYFLHKPFEIIIGSSAKVIDEFNNLNKQYKGLFGLKNGNEESNSEIKKIEEDPFNKQYGWIFSATQVMNHNKITLDQTYQLPVRQALNDLSYLKSLNKYNEKQLKKK